VQRLTEEFKPKARQKRSDRRICHVAPIELARVHDEIKLIAVKTITRAGQQMNNQNSRTKRE